MGFEFNLTVTKPGRVAVEALGRALVKTGRYKLLSETAAQVLLTYSGAELREKWPEDFVISQIATGIGLTIHGGTVAQRDRVLKDLADYARQTGNPYQIDEV